MGLDVSHDAFSAAYSAFNNLRRCVCRSLGPDGSYGPHYLYNADGSLAKDKNGDLIRDTSLDDRMFYVPDEYTQEDWPGLWEFLTHSDCDGEISPDMCIMVADDLEKIVPKVESLGWQAGGHIGRDGGYVAVLQRFIRGCRTAAEAGEPLEFR